MEVINYGNHGMFFDNNLETSFLCLMTHSTIKKKGENMLSGRIWRNFGAFLFSDFHTQEYSNVVLRAKEKHGTIEGKFNCRTLYNKLIWVSKFSYFTM